MSATQVSPSSHPLLLAVLLGAATFGLAHGEEAAGAKQARHEWYVEDVFTVGGQGDDILFGEVTGLSFGVPGELLALDRKNGHYVALDTVSGAELRRVGRRGDGPGEFQQPQHIAAHGGEAVYTFDVAQSRVTEFDLAGNYLSVRPFEVRGPGIVVGFGSTPRGLLLMRHPFPVARRGRPDAITAPQLVLLPAEGPEQVLWDWTSLAAEAAAGRPAERSIDPFAASSVWGLISDTRLAVARSDTYEITLLDLDGRRVGRFGYDVERQKIPEEILNQLAAAMTDEVRARVQLDGFLPVLTAIFPGPENTIVVAGAHKNPSWHIFSQAGEHLGSVPAPENFSPMAARDGLVAGIQPTADFESSLRVVKIRHEGVVSVPLPVPTHVR